MKNFICFFNLIIIFILVSCGPAAENREAMYARSKVFQDSIANVIKSSMDAAAAPASGTAPVAIVDTAAKKAAAQATPGK